METNPAIPAELELAVDAKLDVKPVKPTLFAKLLNLWDSWFIYLAKRHELTVSSKTDASGNNWWHVDDPVTQKKADFASETEVLLWLEKRFYH